MSIWAKKQLLREIRSMIRLDRINEKLEELQDGECIKDNEIIMVEKPNNFHFWDTNLWIRN